MRRLCPVIPLAFALCFAALPAAATTLLRLELEDLARSADLVVVGTVEAERCELDPKTGLIVTIATLVPERTLAGPPVTTPLEVVTLGGRLGEIRQVVDGEARLTVGEEVALFLERLPGGRVRVVGMFEGKLQVVLSAAGDRSVERAAGPPVMDPVSHRYVPSAALSLRLDELEARVSRARAQR